MIFGVNLSNWQSAIQIKEIITNKIFTCISSLCLHSIKFRVKKKITGKSFTTNYPHLPLKPVKVTHEFERIVFGRYCVQDLMCCILKALH